MGQPRTSDRRPGCRRDPHHGCPGSDTCRYRFCSQRLLPTARHPPSPDLQTAQINLHRYPARRARYIRQSRAGCRSSSLHTNYDIASGGLNDLLAHRIGLSSCAPLKVTTTQELVKLVVFVPEDHLDQVRSALFPHTASLGNYRDCSFAAAGEGTFTPLEGAKPFIGTVGDSGTRA